MNSSIEITIFQTKLVSLLNMQLKFPKGRLIYAKEKYPSEINACCTNIAISRNDKYT